MASSRLGYGNQKKKEIGMLSALGVLPSVVVGGLRFWSRSHTHKPGPDYKLGQGIYRSAFTGERERLTIAFTVEYKYKKKEGNEELLSNRPHQQDGGEGQLLPPYLKRWQTAMLTRFSA